MWPEFMFTAASVPLQIDSNCYSINIGPLHIIQYVLLWLRACQISVQVCNRVLVTR